MRMDIALVSIGLAIVIAELSLVIDFFNVFLNLARLFDLYYLATASSIWELYVA